MPTINRHFVRCPICLAVAAIDERLHELRCGICETPMEYMGRVEQDRLVRDELRTPCDDRCTFARGPHCDCKCGGKNHGSKLTVVVRRDCGPLPVVTPSHGRHQAELRAREYRSARAELLRQLDPLLEQRRAGWLPAAAYARMRDLQRTNAKTAQARDHAARVRAFRAAGIVPTPEPISPRDWTPSTTTCKPEPMMLF
jgi:hypothetical protein